MFIRGRRFGQDWETTAWESQQEVAPAAWVKEWVAKEYQPGTGTSGATVSSGVLPILQSVITAAGSVGTAYLGLEKTKVQAQQAAIAPKLITTTQQPITAGFDLGGNLPILAILGIGAFLVMRGGKSTSGKRRRR